MNNSLRFSYSWGHRLKVVLLLSGNGNTLKLEMTTKLKDKKPRSPQSETYCERLPLFRPSFFLIADYFLMSSFIGLNLLIFSTHERKNLTCKLLNVEPSQHPNLGNIFSSLIVKSLVQYKYGKNIASRLLLFLTFCPLFPMNYCLPF